MLLNVVAGVWCWALTAVVSLLSASTILVIAPLVRRVDPAMKACHWIGVAWAHTIVAFIPWWKFKIEGLQNIPADAAPVIYVANHQSQLDIFALYFLRKQFRWMAKAGLFRVPIVGPAMHACRYVPVERRSNEGRRKSLEASKRHLREGISMAFFPEGTRSLKGEIQPFKRGAFALAAELGCSVIPIAIEGTDKMLPPHSYFPKAASVSIRVLPAIHPRGQQDDTEWLATQAALAIAQATGRPLSSKFNSKERFTETHL